MYKGTSDPEGCLLLLKDIVFKAPADRCYPKPCAISDFYEPSVPDNMPIYAVGAYRYNIPDQILDGKQQFTSGDLLEYGKAYCAKVIDIWFYTKLYYSNRMSF